MKNKHSIMSTFALCLGIFLCTASQASVHFSGISGSYAASDGQLAGGQVLTNWTVELWVNPAEIGRHQGIFNNGGVAWKGLELSINAQGGFGFLVTWPNTYYTVESIVGIVTTNQWQLLTVVGDGDQLRLYRNGVKVGIAPSPGQASFVGIHDPSMVGAFSFGLSDYGTLPDANFFNGKIADFRVWGKTLSDQEIASHVTIQPTTSAFGLLNWIPFNETNGNTFYDVVSGVNGSLYNTEFSPDNPSFIQIPHPAAATAQVVNGFVVGITITDPGYGYTNAPAIEITGEGHGATAVCTVSNGIVSGITITDAGTGYTNAPDVLIASPPFMPWLDIAVSQVKVTQHVVLGHKYVLEASTNLVNWTQVGDQFTATKEVLNQVFDVDVTGRSFRIREVQ